ncbi:MAG TPA: c-type cytochrome [Gemmatimonadaceae bacterium]|nr:c-type cytochrome [Gemmatimonadaceae bacterium]
MSRWRRRLGLTTGGLLTLAALFVAVIWGLSERRLGRTWRVEPRPVTLTTDSATLARGQHLATAVAKCTDCHGPDLGGVTMIENAAMGRLASSNLTAGVGGVAARYTDSDWIRAIRHGIDTAGHPLLIMPSEEYASLSDADLGAIIAYIKSVPPVDRTKPARKINLLPRVLLTFGGLPAPGAEVIPHDAVGGPAAPAGVTRDYGRYLAVIGGCTSCHTASLAGGKGGPPGSPPPTNITPGGIGHWTEADFFRALREGKRPDGTAISEAMPWKAAGKMTDDEIRALWIYLRSVPARKFGEG